MHVRASGLLAAPAGRGERVGELLAGVGEAVVGVVDGFDDLDVLVEQGGQAAGELACVRGQRWPRPAGGRLAGVHHLLFGALGYA